MSHETRHYVALAILNIPLYYVLFRIIFGNVDEFLDCVKFYFMPDFISMFRGELLDDWWKTLKLTVFLTICFGTVYSEYRFFFQQHDHPPPAAVSFLSGRVPLIPS